MANWHWIGRIHRAVYRASGGRVGGRLAGRDMLLLTTTGRRSGEPRTTPLSYLTDAADFVVVASNNGAPGDPAWWLNLQAQPNAWVQFGREDIAVVARRATPAEYDGMWAKLQSSYPFFDNYRENTKREIAVVVLERKR